MYLYDTIRHDTTRHPLNVRRMESGPFQVTPASRFIPPDRRMLHRSRAAKGDHVRQTERQRQRGIPHGHVQEVRRHRAGGNFVQPEEQKTSRNS